MLFSWGCTVTLRRPLSILDAYRFHFVSKLSSSPGVVAATCTVWHQLQTSVTSLTPENENAKSPRLQHLRKTRRADLSEHVIVFSLATSQLPNSSPYCLKDQELEPAFNSFFYFIIRSHSDAWCHILLQLVRDCQSSSLHGRACLWIARDKMLWLNSRCSRSSRLFSTRHLPKS